MEFLELCLFALLVILRLFGVLNLENTSEAYLELKPDEPKKVYSTTCGEPFEFKAYYNSSEDVISLKWFNPKGKDISDLGSGNSEYTVSNTSEMAILRINWPRFIHNGIYTLQANNGLIQKKLSFKFTVYRTDDIYPHNCRITKYAVRKSGGKVTFLASIYGANGQMKWFGNRGNEIKTSGTNFNTTKYNITTIRKRSKLVINYLDLNDTGMYSFQLTGKINRTSYYYLVVLDSTTNNKLPTTISGKKLDTNAASTMPPSIILFSILLYNIIA